MRMYSMSGMNLGGSFPVDATLTVNTASPLIARLDAMEEAKKEQTISYLFQLATLSQRKLTAEEMQKFLKDSYAVLELL